MKTILVIAIALAILAGNLAVGQVELAAPSELIAVPVSATEVRLSWRDHSGNEQDFLIERALSVEPLGFSEIGYVGINNTTYSDRNVSGGTLYAYRVRAALLSYGHVYYSDYSNIAVARTNTSGVLPSQIPWQFSLEQNYPNPFNPTTTIRFELPTSSRVTLTVYDMLGRTVTVLVDELCTPGTHKVRFDASNLPSGIYLYHLHADPFSAVRQMVFIR